jgi:hypothetical protein
MASESSFDIVCQVNLQEVDNALQQAVKEISTRFDFRGSNTELKREAHEITLQSADAYKAKSAMEVLRQRLAKRGISGLALKISEPEPAAGGSVRMKIAIQQGIPQEKAKEIARIVKDSGLKVQASIQGDQVRVKGKNRDDLQQVIQAVRGANLEIDMQFVNYR